MSTPKWPFSSDNQATDELTDDLMPAAAPRQAPATLAEPADDGHAAVRAAIASGAVPIFDHNSATDPEKVPNPIDEEAEAAAFRELVAAIRQSAEPGTTVTLMDPDAFAKGLT